MNCLECQEVLQRRLDGVSLAPDASLEQHLAECALCRQRHLAARQLLEGLSAVPRPVPPSGIAARVVALTLRDRQRRRVRLRRSLYLTVGLAAAILLMLVAGYWQRPTPTDAPVEPGPQVRNDTPRPETKNDSPAKEEVTPTIAALSGRLADKTLDEAKVLWTAANPVEGIPMGDMPAVPEPGAAAEPLRQAKQEVSEGLQAVSRSARRALDYFSPMLELPQGH